MSPPRTATTCISVPETAPVRPQQRRADGYSVRETRLDSVPDPRPAEDPEGAEAGTGGPAVRPTRRDTRTTRRFSTPGLVRRQGSGAPQGPRAAPDSRPSGPQTGHVSLPSMAKSIPDALTHSLLRGSALDRQPSRVPWTVSNSSVGSCHDQTNPSRRSVHLVPPPSWCWPTSPEVNPSPEGTQRTREPSSHYILDWGSSRLSNPLQPNPQWVLPVRTSRPRSIPFSIRRSSTWFPVETVTGK